MSVVRRMPKETVVRLVKVWNPLVLRVAVSLGLRAFRKMAAEEGQAPFTTSQRSGWTTPPGRR